MHRDNVYQHSSSAAMAVLCILHTELHFHWMAIRLTLTSNKLEGAISMNAILIYGYVYV